MSAAIELHDVSRRFGRIHALAGLSLSVERGEVYGFLGRNGAGKTTTLRILMGIVKADAGTISLLGESVKRVSVSLKQRIGHVSQEQAFYPWMTANDLGRFVSGLYPTWDGAEFSRLLKRLDVPTDRRAAELSGGTRTKLALALALAPRPQLLLLDEPTTGLDPVARAEFNDMVRDTVKQHGTTAFFSSHLVDEVEPIANRVGILQAGKMLFEGPVRQLVGEVRRVVVGAAQAEAAPLVTLPRASVPRRAPTGSFPRAETRMADARHAPRAESNEPDVPSLFLAEVPTEPVQPRPSITAMAQILPAVAPYSFSEQGEMTPAMTPPQFPRVSLEPAPLMPASRLPSVPLAAAPGYAPPYGSAPVIAPAPGNPSPPLGSAAPTATPAYGNLQPINASSVTPASGNVPPTNAPIVTPAYGNVQPINSPTVTPASGNVRPNDESLASATSAFEFGNDVQENASLGSGAFGDTIPPPLAATTKASTPAVAVPAVPATSLGTGAFGSTPSAPLAASNFGQPTPSALTPEDTPTATLAGAVSTTSLGTGAFGTAAAAPVSAAAHASSSPAAAGWMGAPSTSPEMPPGFTRVRGEVWRASEAAWAAQSWPPGTIVEPLTLAEVFLAMARTDA